MVTVNAAKASSTSDKIGTIQVGKQADISVFENRTGNAYTDIVTSKNQNVLMTMINGDVVVIDNTILTSNPNLNNPGDWVRGYMGEVTPITLNICNTTKTLFSPYSWKVIRDQLNSMYIRQFRPLETSDDINTPTTVYPLNYCSDPVNEPSCNINRPLIYGISDPTTTSCFRYPC